MIDQCHTLRVAAPPSCFSRRVGARKHSAIQPGTCLKHYGSVCIRTRGMNPAAVASDVDAASHAPVQQLESTQDELQSFDDLGVDQRLTVCYRMITVLLSYLPDDTRVYCQRST